MITREQLESLPVLKKIQVVNDDGNKRRIMREEDGHVFVYGCGSVRHGYRYTEDEFLRLNRFRLIQKTDPDTAWHHRIERAKKALESSGLWPDFIEWLDNLAKMTLDDKKLINKLYWAYEPLNPDTSTEAERKMNMKAHFGDLVDKYPFVFTDTGVNTRYIWELSDVKLKAMYFGNHNKYYKQEIQKALDEKRKYSTGRVIVSYDHSFSYDPEKNMAWYSEEYRNCGNGHYYLALDGNTALFCEDD